jgi:hypothetical protein
MSEQRTPEEILKVLEEQALEDEVREVASMSDPQLDDELRKGGITSKAVKDAARSVRGLGNEAPTKPASGRMRARSRWAAWTAIAAVAAAALAVFVWPRDEGVGAGYPGEAKASLLRTEAYAACDRGAWVLCEAKLDEAKRLDPAGEAAAEVLAARRSSYLGQHPDGDFEARPDRSP